MKHLLLFWMLVGFVFIRGAESQQQGTGAAPQLAACGSTYGNVEVICGTYSPEDLEPTPDGKYLIVAQKEAANDRGEGKGIALFDLAAKRFSKMQVTVAASATWGSASCPGPLGDGLVAHGISLNKRTDGALELYVVNHNRRESMEMFELRKERGGWALVWRGCVVSSKPFNDVAALPDGGFIASIPTALMSDPNDDVLRRSGKPIGYAVRWTRAKGEEEVSGTRVGYPNGVVVSSDERFLYLNAWTAREIHRYDLERMQETGVTKVDFMPDNLSWIDPRLNRGSRGHFMLAVGVKGMNGNCPSGSSNLCVQQFSVAEIDPDTMKVRILYESTAGDPLIAGASVGVEVGGVIYVGAYQGDRLLKITPRR